MRRAAILIDGGFLLKRLPSLCGPAYAHEAGFVCKAIEKLVEAHLRAEASIAGCASPSSLLYRVFYYDARPYSSKAQYAVSKKPLDYSRSPEALFRTALFNELKRFPSLALRLGEVRKEQSWILKERPQKLLLGGQRSADSLTDDDFRPGFRQKAVDMRLGLDIATIALKKQANIIILLTGDADFIPAIKLARREGVTVIVDSLWNGIPAELQENIDELRQGFAKPSAPDHNSEET